MIMEGRWKVASIEDVDKVVYHTNKFGRKFEQYQIKCKHCETIVTIPKGRLKRFNYCSRKCTMAVLNPGSPRIKYNCQMCDKECESTPYQYSKYKNHFCSRECSIEYKNIINKVYNKCGICETWFAVRKSLSHQICCSIKCQGVWQSINLVGKKANNYKSIVSEEMRTHKCDWCGTERLLKPYDVKNKITKGKKYFCGKDCYREWYAKDWSQQEEWKEESRKRAVTMLQDGTFGKADTAPQIILNDILKELNIEYINEYNCVRVSIDSYLPEHNLMIEVNGRYWHADPRYYPVIEYQMQYDRVINDRRKHGLIKSQYDIEILYLWEDDLMNNTEECKLLINEYIKNKGILSNYQSFNYHLHNKEIKINKNIIIPYLEYDLSRLHEIFKPTTKEKRSHKQLDKWITFNCEICGNEKEQLISRYKKSKTHSCSVECARKNKIGKSRDFYKAN